MSLSDAPSCSSYPLQDRRYLRSQVSEQLIAEFLSSKDAVTPLEERITYWKREVLQLISNGNINIKIAETLDISERTVETYPPI